MTRVDPPDVPSTRLNVAAECAGLRADAFLSLQLPQVSRTRLRRKIQMGEALLNGRRFATSTRLNPGDEIVVRWRRVPPDVLPPSLPVLFEDAHLLALDKPAGIATHPMGRTQAGTVIQAARYRYAEQIRESLRHGDPGVYPRLVNRLDVFTSGIVLIARTREMHLAMQALAAARHVTKVYVALVEGSVAQEEGSITLPVGRDPVSAVRVKMAVRRDGLASITNYRVLRRLPPAAPGDVPGDTLLEVTPVTGRQHQIRVHLAAIGHPVRGDLLYKNEELFLRYQANEGRLDDALPARHCLHAARVAFVHPLTGVEVQIESPTPADFLAFMAREE